jgi:hypothetical protein
MPFSIQQYLLFQAVKSKPRLIFLWRPSSMETSADESPGERRFEASGLPGSTSAVSLGASPEAGRRLGLTAFLAWGPCLAWAFRPAACENRPNWDGLALRLVNYSQNALFFIIGILKHK